MLGLLSFLNGLYHGLGSDHLMAITTLASRGGTRRQISLVGLRFGLGHMGILVLLSAAALMWNFSIPPSWESRAEAVGGGLLIALGLWTFTEWLKDVGYVHSHAHTHDGRQSSHSHLHFHLRGDHPHQHTHIHFSSLLGAFFAFSGLRALLMSAFPILSADSLHWALFYILAFGLGIVVSMTAFGLLLGSWLGRGLGRRWVSLVLSAASIGLGTYWIWSSL